MGIVVLASWSEASAIIRRHDKEDARYLELGASQPAVTRLGGGTATLIAPQWLLTAGHVAANLSPFDRSVRFGDASYAIEGVVIHPNSAVRPRRKSVDLALVRLSTAVQGVPPVAVYDKDDEHGQTVLFVGPGLRGDGLTGPTTDDGKMRGATNTVAGVLENHLTFRFDAPPEGTEWEGISGPGDSGGPALADIGGRTWILGVSSANDDAGAAGPCRYGSTEYYARVSTAIDWIRATLDAPVAPRVLPGSMFDLRTTGWPDGRAAQVAAAFFDAYGRGTDEAMATFETDFRAESALRDRPVNERVASWRKFRSEWGSLSPRRCIEADDGSFHVLLRADGEKVWKSFQFIFESSAPFKLTGIQIASPVAGE